MFMSVPVTGNGDQSARVKVEHIPQGQELDEQIGKTDSTVDRQSDGDGGGACSSWVGNAVRDRGRDTTPKSLAIDCKTIEEHAKEVRTKFRG